MPAAVNHLKKQKNQEPAGEPVLEPTGDGSGLPTAADPCRSGREKRSSRPGPSVSGPWWRSRHRGRGGDPAMVDGGRRTDASSPAMVEVPASWPWWIPASWPWWREAAAPNRPRPPDPATARRHRPDPPRDAVTGRIRSPRAATGQIRLRTGSSLPSHEPPRSTPARPVLEDRKRERRERDGSVGEKRGRESAVLVDMQWKEMVTGGERLATGEE